MTLLRLSIALQTIAMLVFVGVAAGFATMGNMPGEIPKPVIDGGYCEDPCLEGSGGWADRWNK